jgi:microcin C transport system substrate-binding protein
MRVTLRASALLMTAVAVACSGGSDTAGERAGETPVLVDRGPVSMDKNDYAVFPNADTGADPAVSAEEGGAGFTGEGWETNTDFDLIGDPRALQGGTLRDVMYDFPATLRMAGPEWNSALNYLINPLVYEPLLGLHPTTLDYIPALATHWQISDDQMTYRFRINPNARWSDGERVIADDVVATWHFRMDEGLQDPSNQITFSKFDPPVAESPYIVSVRSNQLNWRNFLYFSGMSIFPAHVLRDIDGETYLTDYNFKMLPGTGPYIVNEEDVISGQSVTIRRRDRDSYWAADARTNVGIGNFDAIRKTVVRDRNLALEMFKRGDLDYYYVTVSREWIEELSPDTDRIAQGLIQKRKIYNSAPSGVQGLAFNTRRGPWDDIRVRQALAHLMNRDLLIERLFFSEYVPMNSYFPGGVYENPNNPTMSYDPELALALLADAGWDSRDAQGRLVRNGEPFRIELLYSQQGSEIWMTVYQEDLRRVGVGLNLRLVTPETLFRLVMERQFDLASIAWGALLFPNPETSFHSRLAIQDNNNNITSFADSTVDDLLEQYDVEFNQVRRVELIREVDGILAEAHPYVLAWDAPFQRIAYWNKFGMPESILSRIGDYEDLISTWWFNPERVTRHAEGMRDASVTMDVGEVERRYWQEYALREADRSTDGVN